jgi:Zinc finger, C2H2 type
VEYLPGWEVSQQDSVLAIEDELWGGHGTDIVPTVANHPLYSGPTGYMPPLPIWRLDEAVSTATSWPHPDNSNPLACGPNPFYGGPTQEYMDSLTVGMRVPASQDASTHDESNSLIGGHLGGVTNVALYETNNRFKTADQEERSPSVTHYLGGVSSAVAGPSAFPALSQHDNNKQCPICNKVFNRRCDMVRHQESLHRIREVTCGGCGKSFSRTDALLHHMRDTCGTPRNRPRKKSGPRGGLRVKGKGKEKGKAG